MGSQLFRDAVGFITELSSPEFIRNRNLIELGQLAMREQLEVAEMLFLRRQSCSFSRTGELSPPSRSPRALWLRCQWWLRFFCWFSSVPFSLCIRLVSCFSAWWLFFFFLWQTASSTELVLLLCCNFHYVSAWLPLPCQFVSLLLAGRAGGSSAARLSSSLSITSL